MKTSEQIDKIAPAIIRARGKFPPIVKTKEVEVRGDKGSYTFKYAPLDIILHAINPAMQEEGLALLQGVEGHALVTTLLHDSGQWISHSAEMPAAYSSPRAYGSELTFRRRYGVTSVWGLAAEDDDDGKAAEDALNKKPKKDAMGALPEAASAAAVKKQAYDAMGPKQQEFIRGIAANITALVSEGREDDAYGYERNQRLDAEEQLALWWCLESKVRSALKRAGQRAELERKAAEANK